MLFKWEIEDAGVYSSSKQGSVLDSVIFNHKRKLKKNNLIKISRYIKRHKLGLVRKPQSNVYKVRQLESH